MKRAFSTAVFLGMHVAGLVGWVWARPSWESVGLFAVSYFAFSLGITLGYHRYLAHGSFGAARAVSGLFVWLGCTAIQKGPLWWMSIHRYHHRHADTDEDSHSPNRGLYWAHIGWNADDRFTNGRPECTAREERTPFVIWLDAYPWLPALLWISSLGIGGGWSAIYFGFVLSSLAVIHATCAIGSLAHAYGYRNFETTDGSRNHRWLGWFFCGEGWHNNHHHDASRANFAVRPSELDVGFWVLRGLKKLGLVELSRSRSEGYSP